MQGCSYKQCLQTATKTFSVWLSWQTCAGYEESLESESLGESSVETSGRIGNREVEEDEDESGEAEQALDIHVSPYSYNSFLSEVYTAVNNKFKRKVS